jgi:hypothetical protein
MEELITNLHMHTTYSDGEGSHADIVQAAFKAGLDVAIVTDHNVMATKFEQIYTEGSRKVLLLVGQEVHDQARDPQKNHLLIIGANRDLSMYAKDTQKLLEQVAQAEGLGFIAHPNEVALPAFGEDDISWVDWQVTGYTGLELWNGLSEFKARIKSYLHAVFYSFFPQLIARGPDPRTLKQWDNLLASGKKVVAVGGSDAHAMKKHAGPITRILFPYVYHFRSINTHILTPTELTGDLPADRKMVLQALAQGRCFVGYDLPASTRGFRFTAQAEDGTAEMGDTASLETSVTFHIRLPEAVECRLLKDGQIVQTWHKRNICSYIATEPGTYRVECSIFYLGRKRAWIFSNPIYVRKS